MIPTLRPGMQADALVVHVFVSAHGRDPEADRAYVRQLWERSRVSFGLTHSLRNGLPQAFPDIPTTGYDRIALLAGCSRSDAETPYVEEAVLRRVADLYCLSVIREPEDAKWADLDAAWDGVLQGVPASPGVVGSARLYLARLADSVPPGVDAAMTSAVQAHNPPSNVPGGGYGEGVVVPAGFAVWEDAPPSEGAVDRRIVVVAASSYDAELSAWTWNGVGWALPRFGRYLMHAALARYQWRVWDAAQGYRDTRRTADAAVDRLLADTAGRTGASGLSQAGLLSAARELVGLQSGEQGLIVISSRLREMHRTVDIARDNMSALSEDDHPGGLFAGDIAMASSLSRQLDDDLTYLEAARDRAGQVGALNDQLVQRGQQRRQERFSLGLTGAIGAILMVLAAIQSLNYRVPVNESIKPSIVATLGAFALLISLVLLRVSIPDRRWSLGLVWLGLGVVAAASTWIVVATVQLSTGYSGWSWQYPTAAFIVGLVVGAIGTAVRRRPRPPGI